MISPKNYRKKEEGFTIIEVVLVLAIAGLIFLVVFLALPALQRSQRDTQRRNDASRFASQVTQFQSNNSGKLPSTELTASGISTFLTQYLSAAGDTFNDPATGSPYVGVASTPTTRGQFWYQTGHDCGTGAGGRSWRVEFALEGGGTYCVGS